jgi:trans-aconitate methyltransferase
MRRCASSPAASGQGRASSTPAEALAKARARLGERAAEVNWVAADVPRWQPRAQFELWHDRAVFHFLTREDDRRA